MQAVHRSPYAGSWYPDDAMEIQALLESAFARSERRTGVYLPEQALAFVTPHAGPAYSGTVAAAVYRTIARIRPEHIVVLAFPHRGGFSGVGIPDVERISTPLGELEVAPMPGVPRVEEAWVCDHSFEIQIPFLQRAAPEARVTPLYVGAMGEEARRSAADRLAAAWRPGMVFVASSDFNHYGHAFQYLPFPVDWDTGERLRELDLDCAEAAGSIDAGLFLRTVHEHRATVCGTDPIALLLEVLQQLAPGSIYQSVLDYQTSGELTGDFHHSVSYAALAYSRRESFDLSDSDGEALLHAATETLRCLRQTGESRPAKARGSAALEGRRGMFVSLHRGGELLGCIGSLSGRDTLASAAGELALSAALDDPRFRPAAETAGPMDVEISVLTPFRRILDSPQLRAGRHGALLKMSGRSGVLLPQVATEHEWNAEQFLAALARKTHLAPRCWRDPKARLSVFEAQVFARRAAVGS